ncbi:TetR/AcrR family transcriptional regulator C-terminal domain-containing protein [Blastococcus sp. CCUG 61487]|uniref:TetR/AcrR family transcriptional regulator C-terminal domain-containing protein n=1 Tax=Blastococcus sp. CCUG 61487 TaxID=1840703 RepID=UPI0010C0C00A|nr:TetR/AcrR family transcriptional regulator C-terminal domain-containing protein [Blastococcus sp. CCUG 61487]TKJ32316.1 TetR family transcriptional regulator [Blastococcus sp. CCUG 61487]
MTPAEEGDDPDTPEARGGAASAIPAAVPGSARGSLDRRRVLGAAVEFIDMHGYEALTMRRLGAYLGVEGMALYRHVSGREALLDGVVETVMDELYGDPDVLMAPDHGWQDFLHRLAHGVRRIALAHPAVFPLLASRPPAAPWVRPPLRSLRWLECFLGGLIGSGFPDHAAVEAYRAYTSFLLGHLLLEVSQKGVKISPADEAEEAPAPLADLTDYPHLQRLEPLLSQDESAAEFDESLENLLDRLERLLPPPRSRR